MGSASASWIEGRRMCNFIWCHGFYIFSSVQKAWADGSLVVGYLAGDSLVCTNRIELRRFTLYNGASATV